MTAGCAFNNTISAHNDVVTRLTLESGNIEPIRDHTRREAAKRRSGQCHAFRIHSFPRESLDNQLAEYYVFGNLRLQIEFIIIKEKKRNFTSDRIGEHDKAGHHTSAASQLRGLERHERHERDVTCAHPCVPRVSICCA